MGRSFVEIHKKFANVNLSVKAFVQQLALKIAVAEKNLSVCFADSSPTKGSHWRAGFGSAG